MNLLEVRLKRKVNLGFKRPPEDYELPLRPQPVVLKLYKKLIGRKQVLKGKHDALFDRNMFGTESEYQQADWTVVNEMADQLNRLDAAISTLKWVMDMTNTLDLNMDSVLSIDLDLLED